MLKPFFLFRLFDLLEVAVCFVDRLKIGERIAEAGQNLLEVVKLVLIDDTDQHRLFIAGVRAYRLDLCTAVVEFMGDLCHQFLLAGGDNGEFIGRLGALEHEITS